MPSLSTERTERQFSLAYLLAEIALIAVALAAGRVVVHSSVPLIEAQAVLVCITLTSACGALGGLCFHMATGLVAGGVFSIASIPFLCMLLVAAK
jgi:nitrate/nitrite transporter NarK